MTVHANKVKGAAKSMSNAATVFPTVHPPKGEPTAARRTPSDAGSRRRIDLGHLQITGDEPSTWPPRCRWWGSMTVNRRGPPCMPKSQVTRWKTWTADGGGSPLPGVRECYGRQYTRMMLELHRERDQAPGPGVSDGPTIEMRPRRSAASHRPSGASRTRSLSGPADRRLGVPQKIRDAIAAIANSMEQSYAPPQRPSPHGTCLFRRRPCSGPLRLIGCSFFEDSPCRLMSSPAEDMPTPQSAGMFV